MSQNNQAESNPEIAGVINETQRQDLTDLVNKLEKDIDAYKNQALRAQAELDNVRRRLERDVSNAHKYGVERLILELLPIFDSLTRGLEGVSSDDQKTQSIRQGIELTIHMFQEVLKKNGIVSILPASGDPFNPEQHEAMSMQSHPDAHPNTIVQVLQPGYLLHDRVIRAAMVIVAG